jgi:uncharacterized membrane protein
MTDSPSSPSPAPAQPVHPHHAPRPDSPIVRFGGIVGVVACCLGLAAFLAGCAGYSQAFGIGFLLMVAGGAGMVLTVVGGVFRHGGVEDTPILGGIFLNLFAFVGGLLLFALHRGWTIIGMPALNP